jgi:hypothetical protein
MHRAAPVLLLALLILAAPTAAAKATFTPVDRCANQCRPLDEDVNGPSARTGDESVKSVFYFHYDRLIDTPPINLQSLPENAPRINSGLLLPTLVATPASVLVAHFKANTFEGYGTAAYVAWNDGSRGLTHQEPGLASDLEIVGDTIPLYFYVSVYPIPTMNSEGPLGTNVAGALPHVAVRAAIQAGRNPGHGPIVAEYDSGAGDVAGAAGSAERENLVITPSSLGPDIYEVMVPLEVKDRTLKAFHNGGPGFTVTATLYQLEPTPEAQFTQADWRFRQGPETPMRFVLEHTRPMTTQNAQLLHFNQAIFIRWSFLSAWGSYDLDHRSIQVKLEGPSSPAPDKIGLSRPLLFNPSTDHCCHFKPVNATWKFDYRRAELKDGQYTLRLGIMNLQNTYRLEETLTFTIRNGVPTDVPAIGAGTGGGAGGGSGSQTGGKAPALEAGFVLLAALGWAARQRRRGA